ncbi:hypothetical protein H5410_042534 [Solanum commersonii]|uniref:Uncharacterized protein n=1 Tax=Solanum commersonii TaxID=4109 RepID=A0A9J5XXW4_SOLCO|nr:hypothetical protein H5410_042534 [Solanum commersonii]
MELFSHFENHASYKVSMRGEPKDTKLSKVRQNASRGTSGLGYEQHREETDPRVKRYNPCTNNPLFGQAALMTSQGIGNLFVAMVGEEEGINLNKLTIRDAEPGEILQNWTTSPSLFQPESW